MAESNSGKSKHPEFNRNTILSAPGPSFCLNWTAAETGAAMGFKTRQSIAHTVFATIPGEHAERDNTNVWAIKLYHA